MDMPLYINCKENVVKNEEIKTEPTSLRKATDSVSWVWNVYLDVCTAVQLGIVRNMHSQTIVHMRPSMVSSCLTSGSHRWWKITNMTRAPRCHQILIDCCMDHRSSATTLYVESRRPTGTYLPIVAVSCRPCGAMQHPFQWLPFIPMQNNARNLGRCRVNLTFYEELCLMCCTRTNKSVLRIVMTSAWQMLLLTAEIQ